MGLEILDILEGLSTGLRCSSKRSLSCRLAGSFGFTDVLLNAVLWVPETFLARFPVSKWQR